MADSQNVSYVKRALRWAGRRNWWVFCFNGWLVRIGAVRMSTSVGEEVKKHLWEVDHSYYCNRGNYYAPDRYRSWAEFIAEYADADFDLNLVFRWDWLEGPDWGLPEFNGDANYRNGLLLVFWMGQRKGLYHWSEVEVCRADEPAVVEFLRPRMQHLLGLWEPLS